LIDFIPKKNQGKIEDQDSKIEFMGLFNGKKELCVFTHVLVGIHYLALQELKDE